MQKYFCRILNLLFFFILSDPCPPRRKPKDFGKGIRKINLITNHFEVTLKNPNKIIIHYDVDIKSADNMAVRLPKKLRM